MEPPLKGHWSITSQTAEYAVRAVLHIAGHNDDTPVAVTQVARTLQVPEKYLARVLGTLRQAGILHSTRGARGGFRLARAVDTLTLADVVAPFETGAEPPRCLLRGAPCGSGSGCPAHRVWHGVTASVRDFMLRTTLAELMTGSVTPPAATPVSPL